MSWAAEVQDVQDIINRGAALIPLFAQRKVTAEVLLCRGYSRRVWDTFLSALPEIDGAPNGLLRASRLLAYPGHGAAFHQGRTSRAPITPTNVAVKMLIKPAVGAGVSWRRNGHDISSILAVLPGSASPGSAHHSYHTTNWARGRHPRRHAGPHADTWPSVHAEGH